VASDQIKQCPLNDNYLFKTQCRINTCKFFSPTTANRCLGMDIVFSAEDKPVSDAELLRYKFPDKELTVKDVTLLRKKAVDRVKSLIVLHRLIHEISEKCDEGQGMNYVRGRSNIVDRVLDSEPLSLPMLDFQPWMLCFLFDEKFVTSTIGPKFKLKEALKLKTKDFSTFSKDVKIMCSGNTLFNNVV
jgi:hypothetical protein